MNISVQILRNTKSILSIVRSLAPVFAFSSAVAGLIKHRSSQIEKAGLWDVSERSPGQFRTAIKLRSILRHAETGSFLELELVFLQQITEPGIEI